MKEKSTKPKARCKQCTNSRPSMQTIDLLCTIRKIYLKAGKARRCEYFNAKPIKARSMAGNKAFKGGGNV